MNTSLGFPLVSSALPVHSIPVVTFPAFKSWQDAGALPGSRLVKLFLTLICLPWLVVDAGAAGKSRGSVDAITVKDLAGKKIQPLANSGQKATVLFFVMHDCPVANSYAPEIGRIMDDYSAKGVRSYVVYVESDITPAQARQHAKDYGIKAGVLDPKHVLVSAAAATISPEASVFSPAGDVLYLGRIDDRVADFGKRRAEPTRRDLRLTLDAVLAGDPVPARQTKAIGCYIPED